MLGGAYQFFGADEEVYIAYFPSHSSSLCTSIDFTLTGGGMGSTGLVGTHVE